MQDLIKSNLPKIISKIKAEVELQEVIAHLMFNLPSGSEFIIKEHSFVFDKERHEVRAIFKFYVNGRYCSMELDYCAQTTLESYRVYYNYNTSYYLLEDFTNSL